jgi:DNA repair exonuclease SbcCD ATPase subunit
VRSPFQGCANSYEWLSQGSIVAFFSKCVETLDLEAIIPESVADLADGTVLTCVARQVVGADGIGESHLRGAPSVAAARRAVVDQLTRARSCAPQVVDLALGEEGSTDDASLLRLATVLTVLAVTCESSEQFLQVIHELSDETASSLQGAVEAALADFPGIDDIRVHASARGSDLSHASVERLQAELSQAKAEIARLREADSAGEASHFDKEMTVVLQRQVGQLEAQLETERSLRQTAEREAVALRDEVDIAKSAQAENSRLMAEVERYRVRLTQVDSAREDVDALRRKLEQAVSDSETALAERDTEIKALKEAHRDKVRQLEKEVASGQGELARAGAKYEAIQKSLEDAQHRQQATEARLKSAEERNARLQAATGPSGGTVGLAAAGVEAELSAARAQVASLQAEVRALREASSVSDRSKDGEGGSSEAEGLLMREQAITSSLRSEVGELNSRIRELEVQLGGMVREESVREEFQAELDALREQLKIESNAASRAQEELLAKNEEVLRLKAALEETTRTSAKATEEERQQKEELRRAVETMKEKAKAEIRRLREQKSSQELLESGVAEQRMAHEKEQVLMLRAILHLGRKRQVDLVRHRAASTPGGAKTSGPRDLLSTKREEASPAAKMGR